MARPLRISYPGAVYHVTARGNDRQAIVRDEADRQRFVHTLAEMVEHYQVLCHAWVLMENHYHLVLETPHANLSQAIRHLNGVYTQAINRRHQRVGHLFQGRFKAILVEKETYLLELCRYVVLNPVRAGLVPHPRAWRWSSYRATAGEHAVPTWLMVEWVLGHFGRGRRQAQQAYRHFVADRLVSQERPWGHLRSQIYLGSETFLQKLQGQIPRSEDAEIPTDQKQPARPELEAVLLQVAHAYGQKVEDLVQPTRRPSEARQVGIYAARRVAGGDLRTVARRFGLGYTAVSRRVSAVVSRLRRDPRLRSQVEKLFKGKVKT